MRPNRLENIQALRAAAVILVLAIHVQVNEARVSDTPLLSSWLYHGVAGVDLFFVISGFIMVWITRQRGDRPGTLRFLYDRATRIYPAAWLWTGMAMLGFLVAGTLGDWLARSDVVGSFLLYPTDTYPLLGVSWTLVHELYFYIVFAILLRFPERVLPFGLGVWAIFTGLMIWTGLDEQNAWTRLAFHPLTFEFIAGAFAALLVQRFELPRPGLIAGAGALGMLAGALVLGDSGADNYPAKWGRVLAFAPGATLLVIGCAVADRTRSWTAPAWMVTIGDSSYSLYLSHLIVISLIAHIAMRFAVDGLWGNVLVIAAMAIAPFPVALAAYAGFEKPVLSQTRALGRKLFSG